MMTQSQRTELIDKIYQVTPTAIYGFFKEHRFLSNFHTCRIIYEGFYFNSTEAAYQAFKSNDENIRKQFAELSASQAKSKGRQIKLREDWEVVKMRIMKEVLIRKFAFHDDLKEMLIATGDRYLEETNYWGDRFWGADIKHVGENHLGKILMDLRDCANAGILQNSTK